MKTIFVLTLLFVEQEELVSQRITRKLLIRVIFKIDSSSRSSSNPSVVIFFYLSKLKNII